MILQHQHIRGSSTSLPNTSQLGLGVSQNPSGASLPQFDFSNIQVPGRAPNQRPQPNSNRRSYPNLDDPAVLRDILLNDPEQLAMLEQNNPPLAAALKSGDFGEYEHFWAALIEATLSPSILSLVSDGCFCHIFQKHFPP